MCKYKAIFSDVDGTLLNSSHQITSATRHSIRQLSASKKVPFILVSARMPQSILSLQRELGLNEPIVAYGGALVLSEANQHGQREALQNINIDIRTLDGIFGIVRQKFPSISFSMYNKDQWLVQTLTDPWVAQEREIAETEPTPFSMVFSHELQINKVLCMGEPGQIDMLSDALNESFPTLTIYKSKPTYLEIMAAGVRKSTAIQTLENVLGIDRDELVAIGDNYNDIDMLRYAGLGVAMGNAPEEVKAQSDEITGTNDDEGVVQLIEKYF